ncbi:lysozyme [Ralstonia solanacearum]|uniref:lysozyme n=1 Tax=Ralstonia solanacearum TaxID=305 RepID=UPI000B1ED00D|nr:lysozyme [Ralstonia solanacearum]
MAVNKGIVASIAGAAAVSIALFTASYEGERNKVYVDPVGHHAVCSGRDSYGPDGTPLKLGQTFTDDQCSVMLGKDVKTAGQALDRLVLVSLSPGERLAYTDFIFNLGAGAFEGSTLRRKLNAGNRPGACAELLRWDKGKVGGKLVTLPGLTKRRKAEYQQCLSK